MLQFCERDLYTLLIAHHSTSSMQRFFGEVLPCGWMNEQKHEQLMIASAACRRSAAVWMGKLG